MLLLHHLNKVLCGLVCGLHLYNNYIIIYYNIYHNNKVFIVILLQICENKYIINKTRTAWTATLKTKFMFEQCLLDTELHNVA